MRYPEGHKEAVRAGIIANAARALRRDGLAGVSIPDLMKRAGLTHGGFYGHFKDRNELVAAAVMAAAEGTAATVLAPELGDTRTMLETYLSKEHVDNPDDGCVLAALGTEGRRQPLPIRRAFASAARGFIQLLERKVRPKSEARTISDETLVLAAQMVGAVVLARLVDDDTLARRILTAVKRA